MLRLLWCIEPKHIISDWFNFRREHFSKSYKTLIGHSKNIGELRKVYLIMFICWNWLDAAKLRLSFYSTNRKNSHIYFLVLYRQWRENVEGIHIFVADCHALRNWGWSTTQVPPNNLWTWFHCNYILFSCYTSLASPMLPLVASQA